MNGHHVNAINTTSIGVKEISNETDVQRLQEQYLTEQQANYSSTGTRESIPSTDKYGASLLTTKSED